MKTDLVQCCSINEHSHHSELVLRNSPCVEALEGAALYVNYIQMTSGHCLTRSLETIDSRQWSKPHRVSN